MTEWHQKTEKHNLQLIPWNLSVLEGPVEKAILRDEQHLM